MTIMVDQSMRNASVLAECKGMSLSMGSSGILYPVNSSDFFGHAVRFIKNINGEEDRKVLEAINEVVVKIRKMYFQRDNVEVCYQNTNDSVINILAGIVKYLDNHSLEDYEITSDIEINIFTVLEELIELDPECDISKICPEIGKNVWPKLGSDTNV